MISKLSGEAFNFSDFAKDFCKDNNFPIPNLSDLESHRLKLAHRNHFHLFRRKCDLTGKSILSNVPSFMPFKVYDKSEWFGDKWEAKTYARDYDFNRTFFEQFYDLQKEVPIFSLQNVNSENSEYCSSVSEVKDCYLAFAAYGKCQDIYYSYNSITANDLYYCNFSTNLEQCFYCYNCKQGYNNIGCEYCFSSNNCSFCYSIENCQDCLFSYNLKNKQYCIYNKQYSKDAFYEQKAKLNFGSYTTLHKCFSELEKIKLMAVSRASYQLNCEDCIGNELVQCQNCVYCFNASDSQNLYDCLAASKSSNNYRCYGFVDAEFCYETCGTLSAKNSSFLIYGYNVYDCHYCINLHNCKHCFACVGLKNQSYCILNKQYSKSEYDKLKAKIIERMQITELKDCALKTTAMEWGSFFPAKNSYFPYNLSLAMMHWKLDEVECNKLGYLWHTEDHPALEDKMLYTPPDLISDWHDDLDHKLLKCELTGKTFNILPRVISKFKSENIALIREHPIENILRRCGESKYKIISRKSSKSEQNLMTTFTADKHPYIYSDSEYRDSFY